VTGVALLACRACTISAVRGAQRPLYSRTRMRIGDPPETGLYVTRLGLTTLLYSTSNGTPALSGRVQNLEELVNNLLEISSHCTPSHPFNTSQSVSQSSVEEEVTASLGEGKAFHVDPIVSTWPRDDILGQLTLSIRRFRALALQQLPAIKPTDPLPILPDQAKELIDSRKPVIVTVFVKANCEQGCLQQLGGELFVSLVDSELIMKLPDVINMPHVQLDVSILLVYYLLLYHGCSLEDDKSSASSDLASRLYLQCISILPQWLEKAADTTMYFVGALGMVCWDHSFRLPSGQRVCG
jgi:hypothetical protein